MAHRNNYYPGSTVLIEATIKDEDGVNTDASSVIVTIKDPHGRVIVDEQAMTNTATGIYQYAHILSATAVRGKWVAIVNATTSSRPQIEPVFFTVDRS